MKSTRASRILSIVLSLSIVIGITILSRETVMADMDATTGLTYTITSGEATITGFAAPAGFDGSLDIPDTLGGASVTIIGDRAFANCTSLTGITIPSSVTSILEAAFQGCSSLTGITIPSGVTYIEGYLFQSCSGLTSITVADANSMFKSINGILYSKDGNLLICCPEGMSGSITIPSGVKTIGGEAFGWCSMLTGIAIPISVTSILAEAFCRCSGLTGITIPISVTSIGDRAFNGCASLTSINVDAGNTIYKSGNGILYSKDGTTLICCPGGKTGSIAIPNGVSSIGEGAFVYCRSLTDIMIPSSVTSIGSGVFYLCSSLTDAYFYGNAPTMGSQVFDECASSFTVHYLSGKTGYTNPWNGYPTVSFAETVVAYQTHVQDVGWQDYVSNGAISGTSGQSKRLEAIRIKLAGIDGGIEYRTHVQDYGWMAWSANDVLSGTSGESKRLEAIEIRLTGTVADLYDVYYRVHAQNTGWLDWAKNGESSGTAGFGYRLEAIEIKLVLKGDPAPGATAAPFIERTTPPTAGTVNYKTHVQDVGWQAYVSNGAESGTSGQSKRLEGIQIKLENIAGGIEYSTHIQDIGWQGFVANDAMSGTSGQSKRLEAIKIRLTGEAATLYDVYYCVHAQNTGWLDWAKNGESSGTAGFGYRLEAIKVVLVPKGGPAPGATARAFVQG